MIERVMGQGLFTREIVILVLIMLVSCNSPNVSESPVSCLVVFDTIHSMHDEDRGYLTEVEYQSRDINQNF